MILLRFNCLFWLYACIVTSALSAEPETYRVLLRDKGNDSFQPGSTLYRATQALLSPRALARRAKVLPPDSLVMYADAPIYPPYIFDVEQSGARVLLQLRWRNYVVVACDSTTAAHLRTKPYVHDVQPTSALLQPQTYVANIPPNLSAQEYRYGSASAQLRMLNIPMLHRLGITARDILIGIIDTGFRWREHEALKSTTVLAEYDFINLDSLTANESTDHPNQDSHGTAVMSVLAAWYPDSLIGAAPCAQYLLAKTENIVAERRIEEDAYAAALEWMEANGVDVVSTSLGYSVFDSTEAQYAPGSLDGKTTIVAHAVLEASRRGVLCVVAAGNQGDAPGTVSSPGDAEPAITVGAVADTLLTIPRFTSRGPTDDGRLKPDLAALGVNVRSTSNASPTAFGYASGTSMATPLIAGCAALLLDAFPELTPAQIKILLQSYASHHTMPNTAIGYGVPDVLAAAVAWDILCSQPIVVPTGDSTIVMIGALSNSPIVSAELIDATGATIPLFHASPYFWTKFPAGQDSIRIAFYLSDARRSRRLPSQGFISISLDKPMLPCNWSAEDIMLACAAEMSIPTSDRRALALPADAAMIEVPVQLHPSFAWIYDVCGRLRATIPVAPLTSSIQLPMLERGVYIVTFDDQRQHVSRYILLY